MAGEPGFEPGRAVLETARLPLSYSPSPSFVVTQHSAVVFSTVPTTSFCVVIRTYTEFTCIIRCLRSQPLTRFFATAQLPSNEAYCCQLRPGVYVSSVMRESGILESNQGPPLYQSGALTFCANARKLPQFQLLRNALLGLRLQFICLDHADLLCLCI